MPLIKHIVCGTDFSPVSNRALECAMILAAKHGGLVDVVHVEGTAPVAGRSFANYPEIEQYQARMRRLASEGLEGLAIDPNITVNRKILQGPSIAATLVDYARSSHADLLALGTHGQGGIGERLIGSVAQQVLELAPMSVLTARREATHYRPGCQRVLVPVDFSEASERGLAWAVALARVDGSDVIALHVIEPLQHPAFALFEKPRVSEMFPSLRDRARQWIESQLNSLELHAVHAEGIVAEGEPERRIVEVARDHAADLIVISAKEPGDLRHVVGGTINKLARVAPCPLLVVKGLIREVVTSASAS